LLMFAHFPFLGPSQFCPLTCIVMFMLIMNIYWSFASRLTFRTVSLIGLRVIPLTRGEFGKLCQFTFRFFTTSLATLLRHTLIPW